MFDVSTSYYCIEHIYYANLLLRSNGKTNKTAMFRKIVSNLAFSPALVGQLGFYAKRLKKEEATRRLGLIMTALALVVQSFTVFTPPESANAANGSDFIPGGITSKAALLDIYDKPRSDFKDIMDYAGITRSEIASSKDSAINSKGHGTGKDAWKTWSRTQNGFSASEGLVKHIVPRQPEGGTSTVYSKPLWRYDSTSYTIPNGSSYPAYVGFSKVRGNFAIIKSCGNLVTTSTPKPDINALFIEATCSTIRGKAVDGRDKNARIKVFLYFGGPPGKGQKSDAILTDAKDNKFSVVVPERYQRSAEPTKVWGVMIPLAGWSDSTVQFENTVIIPGGCIKPKPFASCEMLTKSQISRTEYSFDGVASVENGATISAYTFTVSSASNPKVLEKVVKTSALKASTGTMTIKDPGNYTVKLSVTTSDGIKTNTTNCVKNLTITAPLLPSVEIDKTVDGVEQKEVAVNQEFSFKLAVTNTGEVELKNLSVTDTAPSGISFISADFGTIKNNAWIATIPSLGIGETKTITIRSKVSSYLATIAPNKACVNAKEVNPTQPGVDDDCDEASVSTKPPIVTPEIDCSSAVDTQCLTHAKTAKNLTQGVDATTVNAAASDRIEYTIYLENIGKTDVKHTVEEDLADVLEYADLTQTGGGNYNDANKVLSWGDITIKPGERTSYSFVVTLKSTIPTMARGQSEPSSYDCVMLNSFGNTVRITVACAGPKIVETTVSELPKTGPGENMLFAAVVGSVVTFFWARSRQLGKEVRLIRKDFNMGTI